MFKSISIKKLLIFAAIGVAVGLAVTISLPIKYGVISEFSLGDASSRDAVVVAKNSIYDVQFIKSVQDRFVASYDFLPQEERALKREWIEIVRLKHSSKTDNVIVEVRHSNLENAVRLSKAIADQVKEEHKDTKIIRNSNVKDRIVSPDSRVILPVFAAIFVTGYLIFSQLSGIRRKKELEGERKVKMDNYYARTQNWLKDKK